MTRTGKGSLYEQVSKRPKGLQGKIREGFISQKRSRAKEDERMPLGKRAVTCTRRWSLWVQNNFCILGWHFSFTGLPLIFSSLLRMAGFAMIPDFCLCCYMQYGLYVWRRPSISFVWDRAKITNQMRLSYLILLYWLYQIGGPLCTISSLWLL